MYQNCIGFPRAWSIKTFLFCNKSIRSNSFKIDKIHPFKRVHTVRILTRLTSRSIRWKQTECGYFAPLVVLGMHRIILYYILLRSDYRDRKTLRPAEMWAYRKRCYENQCVIPGQKPVSHPNRSSYFGCMVYLRCFFLDNVSGLGTHFLFKSLIQFYTF